MRHDGWLPVIATGVAGGLGSALGLVAASLAARESPVAPLNASAHWLLGEGAAQAPGPAWPETAAGLATHFGATTFWAAVLFGAARLTRATRPAARWTAAGAVTLGAGVVDYGILPRSLSPGWHLVLPPAGVAAGFLGMGLGLGLGLAACRGRAAS